MPDWLRRFDGELAVAPPVGDDQFARAPAKRGVVLLAGEGDRPIVLITAADIRARVRNRLRNPEPEERSKMPDLHEIARKIFWKLCTSPFETDLAFLDLAGAIFPRRWRQMLGWKPAWFVHVDPAEAVPHFSRTREVFGGAGRYFGPFPSGREAEGFIEAIQDVFDLCRDPQCLRTSPHGQRCSYGQMGKCLCPCDGTVSLDAYRLAVAEGAQVAAGGREEARRRLEADMATAAKDLAFERAATLKRKIERLAAFDRPAWRQVAPAEAFRYVLVQPGAGRRQAKLFLADRGWVDAPREIRYPPDGRQLSAALGRMRKWVGTSRPFGPAERWRMGLVAQQLCSGGRRRGLVLGWSAEMTSEALGAAIEAAAGDLRLGSRA